MTQQTRTEPVVFSTTPCAVRTGPSDPSVIAGKYYVYRSGYFEGEIVQVRTFYLNKNGLWALKADYFDTESAANHAIATASEKACARKWH